MTTAPNRTAFLPALALSLVLALCGTAGAREAAMHLPIGDLTIVSPWARATAPSASAGVAFMVVENAGQAVDRLVAARSPAAERVEFHTHLMEDGIMRMRPVPVIEVPPAGKVELKPGGYHLMLLGLKRPLVEGESFPITLSFEHAGTLQVEAVVASIGASAPSDGHGTGHGSTPGH
ncbi:MAG TPA: copper chaperone PCu(A)C [Arenibaculum sp.]|nr:copper chaperone PCu(A)C [Arenibaculum sp.]